LQVSDGMIQVLMADEYERPRYQDMADKVIDLIRGLTEETLTRRVLIPARFMLMPLTQNLF